MASTRQQVSEEQVHLAYNKAKYVYEHPKSTTKSSAASDLQKNHGINAGTANDFIRVFQHLLEGKVFKRALSRYAMDYFLFNIKNDYGNDALKVALSALMSHIVYREEGNIITNRKPVPQNTMRQLYEKFSDQINSFYTVTDEREQEKASKQIKTLYGSREDIKRAIIKYEGKPLELVTIQNISYKRNNYIISLIKQYRGYKCQICNTSILKADGTEYIEAAHIKPHYEGGKASLSNIILLCPNHHKEFDLGQRETKYVSEHLVEINLNNNIYKIYLQ